MHVEIKVELPCKIQEHITGMCDNRTVQSSVHTIFELWMLITILIKTSISN
jgi:hypothetical protein